MVTKITLYIKKTNPSYNFKMLICNYDSREDIFSMNILPFKIKLSEIDPDNRIPRQTSLHGVQN